MKFTIYVFNPTTGKGEIQRRGECPDAMLGKQVRAGESILVGQALCDVQHYIEHDHEGRKVVCKHPPEVVAQRAPKGWQPPVGEEQARLVAKGLNPALAGRLAQRRRVDAAIMQEAGKGPESSQKAGPP
jgi:hypothetical protein